MIASHTSSVTYSLRSMLAPLAGIFSSRKETSSPVPGNCPPGGTPGWIDWSQGWQPLTTVSAPVNNSVTNPGQALYLQWDGNVGGKMIDNVFVIGEPFAGFAMVPYNQCTTLFYWNGQYLSVKNTSPWTGGNLTPLSVVNLGTDNYGQQIQSNSMIVLNGVLQWGPIVPSCDGNSGPSGLLTQQGGSAVTWNYINGFFSFTWLWQDGGISLCPTKVVTGYLGIDIATGLLTYSAGEPNVNEIPQFQWVSFQTQYACCTLPSTDGSFPQCAVSWSNGSSTSGGQCSALMTPYCAANWSNDQTSKDMCLCYLNDSFANTNDRYNMVKETVDNYTQSVGYQYSTTDPFFQQVMPSICPLEFGACDDALNQVCASYTRNDLLNNNDPVLQQLCGCHLPVNTTNYPYTGIGQSNGGDIACDPVCSWQNTIGNAAYQPCTGSACVMDNITVNFINSSGDVTFSNICQGCTTGESTCSCYMSNDFVEFLDSHGNVNIENNCGKCYTFPEGDPENATEVPCPGSPSPPNGGGSSYIQEFIAFSGTTAGKWTIATGILVIVLTIAVVTVWLWSSGRRDRLIVCSLLTAVVLVLLLTGLYYVKNSQQEV